MFKKATLLILMVLTICISAPSHARHYGFDLKETGLIFEYLNDKYKEITDVEVMVNSMYKDYAIASVYAPNFEGKTEILHKLNGNWVTFASGSKLEKESFSEKIPVDVLDKIFDLDETPQNNNTQQVDENPRFKIEIGERICKFASENFYWIYVNAQSGKPNKESFKKLFTKLKKVDLEGLDKQLIAHDLVDEAYNLYYKNGKFSRKDKKDDIQESYFRNCMNSIINKQN